jgi:hypothetical protein
VCMLPLLAIWWLIGMAVDGLGPDQDAGGMGSDDR